MFPTIHTKTLINDKATTKNISDDFQSIGKKIQTRDVFILYLAGHGIEKNGNFHFMPYEAKYENREKFFKGCLLNEEINSLLKSIKALKSLIILDTCYSDLLAENTSDVMLAKRRSGMLENW